MDLSVVRTMMRGKRRRGEKQDGWRQQPAMHCRDGDEPQVNVSQQRDFSPIGTQGICSFLAATVFEKRSLCSEAKNFERCGQDLFL